MGRNADRPLSGRRIALAAVARRCGLSEKRWQTVRKLAARLENAGAEFSLTALAYNVTRANTVIGIPGMIRAVRA